MGEKAGVLRLACAEDLAEVYRLVQVTIRACYADCYTPSVMEAFCRYHSPESVAQDIDAGKVYILEVGNRLVGTITVDGNYIGRVYVLPEEQGKDYGTALMDVAEAIVAEAHPTAILDSSIPGRDVYLHRGYTVAKTEIWDIEQYDPFPADQLEYEVMEKRLRKDT